MMEITCEMLICEVADGITTLADVIAMADVIATLVGGVADVVAMRRRRQMLLPLWQMLLPHGSLF